MAFLTALTASSEGGTIVLRDIQKVRLTGPDGPLARHILGLPDGNGEWSLAGRILARCVTANLSAGAGEPALFWDGGQAPFSPMRVVSICGISREFETELVIQLDVLAASGDAFVSTARQTSEALRLLGGRLTPNASWKWAAPRMSIGGAVVGSGKKPETRG